MNSQLKLHRIDSTKLSKILLELIDILGVEETYELALSYGGTTKYVAKNPRRSSLIKVLSLQAIERLSQTYGGTYIEVPKHAQLTRQIRNYCLLAELKQGKTKTVLAKKYDLTVRHISNIQRAELHSIIRW
ncbi:Mor transcription activator family protein [Pseudoalteromonas mariniglutinosa]|uniref:Mor transcription activator family protein n=1 Tax=Pseudoalteromonas mariniglutinosa TaxID=206042 RepID=UPI003850AAA1